MPAAEFEVLHYQVAVPRKPKPWPEPLSPAFFSKTDYAWIHCVCDTGLTFVLHFLRPDTDWLYEPGSHVANTYGPDLKYATAHLPAYEYARHLKMLSSGRPVFASLDYTYPSANRLREEETLQPYPSPAGVSPDLDEWLNAHPTIRESIIWADSGGQYNVYMNWPETEKAQLRNAFEAAWYGTPIQLDDPPPNIYGGFGDAPATAISRDDAWHLYIAHVAHSLVLEIAGLVGWSLADYGTDPQDIKLQTLFHFTEICGAWNGYGYACNGYVTYESVLPAPPDDAYRFFLSHDLILKNDRLGTIGKVLEWCRDNLTHFAETQGSANNEAHWQYPVPTVSRILAGTVCTSHPGEGLRHYTAGCSGTMHFLKALLRAVNIPVGPAFPDGHSAPCFLSEGENLSHGDDPYNRDSRATPAFPAGELLIDQAAFDKRFVEEPDPIQRLANVSRRAAELMIQYLPDELLHARYLDKKQGLGISPDCHVYRKFVVSYPEGEVALYDLDTLQQGSIVTADGRVIQCDLWKRIDEKINNFGRAFSIPQLLLQQHLQRQHEVPTGGGDSAG